MLVLKSHFLQSWVGVEGGVGGQVVEEGNPGVGLFGCFESTALFEEEGEGGWLVGDEGRETSASLVVMGMGGACEGCEFVAG